MSRPRQPTTERPARLTLRDLADHAKVSRATVSLVLRKSPLVAAETRERVLESMRMLGYVYNRGAANLRTQKTHTVGVAINELVNPYFSELTAAIESALADADRTVFFRNCSENPALQDEFIAQMREYNVEGLVICPARGTSAKTLHQLKAFGVPCVLISRNVPGSGIDYAGNDHRQGSRLATEHVISLGHRRIAMVGANDLISTGIERREGYEETLAAHGIAVEPSLVLHGPPTRSFGVDAIKALLATKQPPTAAVCFNDVIAFGVMLGLRQLGREPGRDFAVVGCDDLAEAALWTPALTTVAIDTVGMGQAAVRLLLERNANFALPHHEIVLMPKLVVRASSGPPVTLPAQRRGARLASTR